MPDDQPEIRRYEPKDLSPLYEIEKSCFTPPLRFTRDFLRELAEAPAAITLVAEIDQRLIGFAITHLEAESTRAYLQTIDVAPAHRGGGVASKLLRHIEQTLTAAGATAIALHVATSNLPAIALYTRHGFVRTGFAQRFYPGKPGDAFLYEKTLHLPDYSVR